MAKITTPAPEASKPDLSPAAPTSDPVPPPVTPDPAPEPPTTPPDLSPAAVDKATITLLAPDGATSCTVDGVEYGVVDGEVEVDPAHAGLLIESHGYVTAE